MHSLEKLGTYEEKATHIQREASQVDIKTVHSNTHQVRK